MKLHFQKALFFALFICLLSSSLLRGQEIPRTVIGNAGGYYENLLFGNLHWTVGEVAVSGFQNNLELGEGFHQVYYDLLVKNENLLPVDWKVSVYPNPTAEFLHINISGNEQVRAQLFSSAGQLIKKIEQFSSETTIQMSEIPAGVYWLQLFDNDGRNGSFQIQKISQ